MCYRKWLKNVPKCMPSYTITEKERNCKVTLPLKESELNNQWICFANRNDWVPTKQSVLCELQFEESVYAEAKKVRYNGR